MMCSKFHSCKHQNCYLGQLIRATATTYVSDDGVKEMRSRGHSQCFVHEDVIYGGGWVAQWDETGSVQ